MSASAAPGFFVPGTARDSREAELRYDQLRAAAGSPEGGAPTGDQRIFAVECRHAGRDCVIEVGGPSPFDGEEVLAIFVLGGHAGYAIATASSGAGHHLGRHVYSVTEFS